MSNVVVFGRSGEETQALVQHLRSESRAFAVDAFDELDALREHVAAHPVEVIVVGPGQVEPEAASAVLAVWSYRPSARCVATTQALLLTPTPTLMCLPEGADPEDIASAVRDSALEGQLGAGRGGSTLALTIRVAILTGWTGTISLRVDRRKGAVRFEEGRVVGAAFGGVGGYQALERALREPGGTLCEMHGSSEPLHAVEGDIEALLDAVSAEPSMSADPERETGAYPQVVQEEPSEYGGGGFELFSEADLAELALDDSMAVPLPGNRGTTTTGR